MSRDVNRAAALGLAIADAVRLSAEAETGLGGGGPAALVAVVAEPGISVQELHVALGLTHPGTVRLVDRLVERGWLRREPRRGRTVGLVPTPEGVRVERRVAEARLSAVERLLNGVDAGALRQVAAVADGVLARSTESLDDLRRLCRLCDRSCCDPCPVWDALDGPGDDAG